MTDAKHIPLHLIKINSVQLLFFGLFIFFLNEMACFPQKYVTYTEFIYIYIDWILTEN